MYIQKHYANLIKTWLHHAVHVLGTYTRGQGKCVQAFNLKTLFWRCLWDLEAHLVSRV